MGRLGTVSPGFFSVRATAQSANQRPRLTAQGSGAAYRGRWPGRRPRRLSCDNGRASAAAGGLSVISRASRLHTSTLPVACRCCTDEGGGVERMHLGRHHVLDAGIGKFARQRMVFSGLMHGPAMLRVMAMITRCWPRGPASAPA